ncbi:hypothetical protein GS597_01245 [Synechococcales cyanobacterium C]|uniref:Uncharacterized protein n=1 Tax=Petrachloros mirabilis ULC683 TaxID=2781853 RepID=A0A8K2AGR7_9CYAN|nr:hypothetical protein [Petrachloros mirabilis]NCJ05164.1 hypothetical protein [Petrachloros mirabilis ULC683]
MNPKVEYLKQLELEIAEADQSLESLKNRYQAVRESAQHEEIERLETHLASARIRLQDLALATEEGWQDLKVMLEDALHGIRDSLQKLLQS